MTSEQLEPGAPRFAVIFKTYFWDDFVLRQARRLEAASAGGDFYISIDATNFSPGPIPFARAVRVTNAELIASGLPDRFESGSLLWWNPDYVHHHFQQTHPDYDYYVFVEYDAVVQGEVAALVRRAAAEGADMLAMPIETRERYWYWELYHRQVYRRAEMRGALLCISLFSRRAAALLAQRRREMGDDPAVRYWPGSEVFVPTEVARAGLRMLPLSGFADTRTYDAFPPLLEEDLPEPVEGAVALLHPVLDQPRFIASMLKSSHNVQDFFLPRSRLRRELARFPRDAYAGKLTMAGLRRLRQNFMQRYRRLRLRLSPGLLLQE